MSEELVIRQPFAKRGHGPEVRALLKEKHRINNQIAEIVLMLLEKIPKEEKQALKDLREGLEEREIEIDARLAEITY